MGRGPRRGFQVNLHSPYVPCTVDSSTVEDEWPPASRAPSKVGAHCGKVLVGSYACWSALATCALCSCLLALRVLASVGLAWVHHQCWLSLRVLGHSAVRSCGVVCWAHVWVGLLSWYVGTGVLWMGVGSTGQDCWLWGKATPETSRLPSASSLPCPLHMAHSLSSASLHPLQPLCHFFSLWDPHVHRELLSLTT
jgi:hypothetical protein